MSNSNLKFLTQKPENVIFLKVQEQWQIFQATLSKNQKYLVTYHSQWSSINQKIIIWDLQTKKQRKIIGLEQQQFIDIQFSSDNNFLFITFSSQINIVDLLSIEMASKIIISKLQISRIAFNPTYHKAICVYKQENHYSIWDISSMQKQVDNQTQNIIRNAKFLDLENFLTISIEDDAHTDYQVWNSLKLIVVKQWKGKYVSGDMQLYLHNQDTLIVDFRDEYQHYIQIWNLINAHLIKTLFSEIVDFTIKKVLGFKLIVEIESDDEDENDEDMSDECEKKIQDVFVSYRIYDLLTCKQKKMSSYIGKNNDYKILSSAIVEQRIVKQNSEIIVYLQ